MDTRQLINEREARYGSMTDNAQVTWDMMAIFQRHMNWRDLSAVQKHIFYMTAHKMARMLCGDPNYLDNYDDIIGYWSRGRDFIPDQPMKPQHIKSGHDGVFHRWEPGTPEDGGHHARQLPDLRDGPTEEPELGFFIDVVGDDNQIYYLVDRDHYSDGAIEHLPRLAIELNYAEHAGLPSYYRALYAMRADGGFSLKKRYIPNWNK